MDELFGSRFGTLILSGLIGILIYASMIGSWDDSPVNHWYLIALGYPVFAVLRSVYWSKRRQNIEQRLYDAKGPQRKTLLSELEKLAQYNPTMATELTQLAKSYWSVTDQPRTRR
jgi:hypothetical protein